MTNQWQQLSIVSPGGTVFAIAADDRRRYWLATEAGLYFRRDGGWLALSHAQPLQQLSALTTAGKSVFAGNGQGQIVYTGDGGHNWYQGNIGQSAKPVSWLIASPNFERDRVLLAGTDGAGILRSTDGGRNWRLSNFGLHDFSVIALEVAPDWGRREIIFAATLQGFYRSPNGGRAWKKADAGLEEAGVQAIAVSPDFAQDQTLFVGTEAKGLFRSTDQGKSWQPCNEGLASAGEVPSINCLWLHPDFAAKPVCLAGCAAGQIFYSADGGERWQTVVAEGAPVLCFGGNATQLYAGLHEQGLLSSIDCGQTWTSVADLAARPLTRLVTAEGQLYAFGPWEDLWRSLDGGQTWGRVAAFDENRPLFSLAVSPSGAWLLGTGGGLLRSDDNGQSWQVVLEAEFGEVASMIFSPDFAADGQAWVGTSSGQLLTSVDDGRTWTALTAPQPGLPLLALDLLPAAVSGYKRQEESVLAAATLDPNSGQVTLWHSPRHKIQWTQWMQATAHWPSVYLSAVGEATARAVVCIDRRGWCTSAAGWERVLGTKRPIGRLRRVGANGLLALTGRQVVRSSDGGATWSAFDEGLADQVLQDVAVSSDGQTAYVLSTGGVVWRRDI